MKKLGAGLLVLGAIVSGSALPLPGQEQAGQGREAAGNGRPPAAQQPEPARQLRGAAGQQHESPLLHASTAQEQQSPQPPSAGREHPSAQHGEQAWRPVRRNLHAQPERLLPAVVSQTHPVRVMSTSIDHSGRPVVSVRTATDHATATALIAKGQRAPRAVSVEIDVPVSAAAADPFLPMQWDLARVRADQAWQHSTGAGVTVAVIDSGVDSSHPDLAGHVLPGGDFITGTEGASVDPHGHGTHVAGTIAALAGNGEGIAGMAPHANILPVRVLDANGNGYMSDVANGIAYAAEHGADVINLSVSATTPVGAVTNAVAYARSKGVVVVAAAGNARRTGSPTAYPAADPGVIAVAGTASDDSVAAYSNRGGYVDVAAPGSDITSTFPGNRYMRMNGTSMAAPHVSALAALLKGADRALTPDQVEHAVTATAVDLGAPGRDDDFGAGRIDAAAAMATLTPVRPSPSEPAQTTTPPTTDTPQAAATPTPYGGNTPSPGTDTPQPPAPNTPAPTRTPSAATPAPDTPIIRLVRPGPGRLSVFVIGVQGVPVQVQCRNGNSGGDGWTTILTYPATTVARFDGLVLGLDHRVVVNGTTSDTIRL